MVAVLPHPHHILASPHYLAREDGTQRAMAPAGDRTLAQITLDYRGLTRHMLSQPLDVAWQGKAGLGKARPGKPGLARLGKAGGVDVDAPFNHPALSPSP